MNRNQIKQNQTEKLWTGKSALSKNCIATSQTILYQTTNPTVKYFISFWLTDLGMYTGPLSKSSTMD